MFRSLLQAYYLRQSQKRPLSPLEHATQTSVIPSLFEANFFFKPDAPKRLFAKFWSKRTQPSPRVVAMEQSINNEGSEPIRSARFGKYDVCRIHNALKYGLTSIALGSALGWFLIESYQGLSIF